MTLRHSGALEKYRAILFSLVLNSSGMSVNIPGNDNISIEHQH